MKNKIPQFHYTAKVHLMHIALSLMLSLIFTEVSAQQMLADSVSTSLARNEAIHFYDTEIARNSMIYNGPGYFAEFGGMKGHQYFIDNYWEYGSVTYNGSPYDSIELMYDIYQDQLLIENFNSRGYLSPIKLYGPKVDAFQLFGYQFEWMEEDTTSGFKPGYYNVMFKGKGLALLVKRKKEITNSDELGVIREMFVERDKYYVLKDGIYQQVRRKRSILKLLSGHKKELKRYIHENRISFKEQTDLALAEVLRYYSTLM